MLIVTALKPSLESVSEESQDEISLEQLQELDTQIENNVREAEDAESIFNKLHTASTSLEEIQDLLIDSQNTGGIVPSTAHALGIALEYIHVTLGFISPEFGVSLEDFDGDARKDSTTLVLESVTETLQKVWKTILEFIDKMIQWFKDLIGDNLQIYPFLEKRAAKIKASLAHVKTFNSIEVTDELLRKRLYSPDVPFSKIVPAYQDMMTTISNSFSAVDSPGITSNINAAQLSFKDRDKDLYTAYTNGKKHILEACNAYGKEVFNNDTTKRESVKKFTSEEGVTYSTPTVLGGIGWYYVKPTTVYEFQLCRIGAYHCEEGSYEHLDSLNEKEIKYILATFETMKIIQFAFRKNLDQMYEIRKNLTKFTISTSQELTGASNVLDPRVRNVSSVVRAMLILIVGISGSTYSHSIRVTRDMFRLCEISIKTAEQKELSTNREMVPA